MAFYTFLIQKDSFIGPMYQSSGISTEIGDGGLGHFSPDGTKYALGSGFTGVHLFDFDRCSGVFSNPVSHPFSLKFYDTFPDLLVYPRMVT